LLLQLLVIVLLHGCHLTHVHVFPLFHLLPCLFFHPHLLYFTSRSRVQ
jgi:hypothetical protein